MYKLPDMKLMQVPRDHGKSVFDRRLRQFAHDRRPFSPNLFRLAPMTLAVQAAIHEMIGRGPLVVAPDGTYQPRR